ncbi:MAG: hypothetical protein JNK72_00595 [Myxococcales bacterium]|nr:hypothetical protein [Myxococcales bacterium]
MATKDIYELSRLKVKIKLNSASKKNSVPGRLILIKDNVAAPPINVTVTKQMVEHDHTFVAVEDDKEFYELKFKVECDSETVEDTTLYKVFPVNCVVTVNDKDDAPLNDKPFKLVFSDGSTQTHEATNGTCDCKLKRKATFVIEAGKGMELLDPAPGLGRNRTVKMAPALYTASIVSPVEAAEVKQYVNVTSANTGDTLGHDHKGRKLKVNLLGVPLQQGKTIAALVKNTDKFFIKLTLTDITKRNKDRTNLEGVEKLKKEDGRKTITGQVAVGADGKASFTVKFGPTGLEKVKLEVGTTDECLDASIEYKLYRKIYIQKMLPAGENVDLATAVAALEEVGIEAEAEADVTLIAGNLPVGSVQPGGPMGLGVDAVIIGDHNIGGALNAFGDLHNPHSLYVMFAHFQFDAGDQLTHSASAQIAQGDTVQLASGNTVDGVAVPIRRGGLHVLPQSLHSANKGATATWSSNAAQGVHQGASGNVPAANIHIDWGNANYRRWVCIELPPAAKVVTDDGETVTVRVTAELAAGPYLGWSPSAKSGTVIALHANSAQTAPAMNMTVSHEIGHAIRHLVSAPPGLNFVIDHGRRYTGRGHSGEHCAEGVSTPRYLSQTKLEGERGGTCTMFGSDQAGQSASFCTRCKPFLLAMEIQDFT